MERKIITLAIIAIFFLARYARKASMEAELKQLVTYCILEMGQAGVAKLNTVLPENFRITQAEKKDANRILKEYRKDVILCFFKDSYKKKHYADDDFFAQTLWSFLDEKSWYYNIDSCSIMNRVGDIDEYSFVCELTDFGAVFYKMKLASALLIRKYDEKSSINITHLYEVLSTRKVKLFR